MGGAQARALLLGFWVLPALVATVGFRVEPSRYNPELSLWGIFVSQLLIWQAWGVWSLLIVSVESRFALERGRVLRAVAVHLPLSAVVTAGQILVISHVADALGLTSTSPRALRALRAAATREAASRHSAPRLAATGDSVQTAVGSAPIAPLQQLGMESRLALGLRQYGDLLIVVYCAVVGAQAAVRWNRRWGEESLRNARRGEHLAQASLQALRAQLNPHFMFNALNSIVTLIARDTAAAETMTPRLSELLRAPLAAGDVQESNSSASPID